MTDADKQWQRSLAQAFRSVSEVYEALGIAGETGMKSETFPVLVPADYLGRMQPGDPSDPLLRQVQWHRAEDAGQPEGFSMDPVGEHHLASSNSILQKYQGRALVVVTQSCAVHCRYCFRRHYPYSNKGATIAESLAWLEQRPDIDEVILSGGDPLVLATDRLEAWLDALDDVAHLRAIRIHSRVPVVLPDRITAALIQVFHRHRRKLTLVVHANHPQELVGGCADGLRQLSEAGIRVLNQSVLLQGVNDDADVLVALSWRLHELGVLPYYLHQLDRVSGAAHFSVEAAAAEAIVDQLRARLPGYLVPRYVEEVAGATSKMPVEFGRAVQLC